MKCQYHVWIGMDRINYLNYLQRLLFYSIFYFFSFLFLKRKNLSSVFTLVHLLDGLRSRIANKQSNTIEWMNCIEYIGLHAIQCIHLELNWMKCKKRFCKRIIWLKDLFTLFNEIHFDVMWTNQVQATESCYNNAISQDSTDNTIQLSLSNLILKMNQWITKDHVE